MKFKLHIQSLKECFLFPHSYEEILKEHEIKKKKYVFLRATFRIHSRMLRLR